MARKKQRERTIDDVVRAWLEESAGVGCRCVATIDGRQFSGRIFAFVPPVAERNAMYVVHTDAMFSVAGAQWGLIAVDYPDVEITDECE